MPADIAADETPVPTTTTEETEEENGGGTMASFMEMLQAMQGSSGGCGGCAACRCGNNNEELSDEAKARKAAFEAALAAMPVPAKDNATRTTVAVEARRERLVNLAIKAVKTTLINESPEWHGNATGKPAYKARVALFDGDVASLDKAYRDAFPGASILIHCVDQSKEPETVRSSYAIVVNW